MARRRKRTRVNSQNGLASGIRAQRRRLSERNARERGFVWVYRGTSPDSELRRPVELIPTSHTIRVFAHDPNNEIINYDE